MSSIYIFLWASTTVVVWPN